MGLSSLKFARYQPKGQPPTSTRFRKLQVARPHGHLEKPSSVNWASDSRGMVGLQSHLRGVSEGL